MWKQVESGVLSDLLAVQTWPDGRSIAVGRAGVVLRREHGRWGRETPPFSEDLYGVWGLSADDYIAVGGNLDVGGQSKILRHRAGHWSIERSGIQSLLLSASGRSAEDVRAVGFNGGIVEWTPTGWREIDAKTNEHLFAIAAVEDRWVVAGLHGTVQEWRSEGWQRCLVAESHFTALASDANSVFVVGYDRGVFRRPHGRSIWKREAVPINAHLFGVTATATSVVACGSKGAMIRRHDTGWIADAVPTEVDLFGISGSGETIVAVGARGTVLVSS